MHGNIVGNIRRGLCATIGGTPLIRLDTLSEATGCEILGKAEFLNPGGSVKDRAALGLVEDAQARGLLRRDGTIVEGTAGNTGIGLALVGNAKGYRTIIVIPETQTQEKIDLLRAMGAEVRLVPGAPYTDANNYNHVAKRLAAEIAGGWHANQFENTANREFHARTTGPEIWAQTEGRVTAFVAAIGTGGTLAGVARCLKEKNPKIEIVCADPHGASMWSWFKLGHLAYDDGDSVIEGIGQDRVTGNASGLAVDEAYRVGDLLVIEMLHYLLRHEGLFIGASSALNVCGAVKHARRRGKGQVVVTILADGGGRYVSRLFNADWLKGRGLTPRAVGKEFLELLDEPDRPT